MPRHKDPGVRVVECVMEGGPLPDSQVINRPADVLQYVPDLPKADREKFVVLHLNTRHKVLRRETTSVGSLDASLVHPREVYKAAVKTNTAKILLVHNHPGGDITPSPEDRALTKRLVNAGALMGIPVIDHVIVTAEAFLSFQEAGILPESDYRDY